LYTKN